MTIALQSLFRPLGASRVSVTTNATDLVSAAANTGGMTVSLICGKSNSNRLNWRVGSEFLHSSENHSTGTEMVIHGQPFFVPAGVRLHNEYGETVAFYDLH